MLFPERRAVINKSDRGIVKKSIGIFAKGLFKPSICSRNTNNCRNEI